MLSGLALGQRGLPFLGPQLNEQDAKQSVPKQRARLNVVLT